MVKRLLVRIGIGVAIMTIAGVKIKKRQTARNRDSSYLEPKWDDRPSVDAKFDTDEIGLTQLDSIYRSEWVANTYPRSEEERKALEE